APGAAPPDRSPPARREPGRSGARDDATRDPPPDPSTSLPLHRRRPDRQDHDLAPRRHVHPQPLLRSGDDPAPTLEPLDPLQETHPLRLEHRPLTTDLLERLERLERAPLPPDHEAQRAEQNGKRQRRPDHPRLSPHQPPFRHARNRALRARGFRATSASDGYTGLRVNVSPSGTPRHRHTGS